MGGRPVKHDYDSDKFYDDVFTFAMQCLNDSEIADALDLEPEVFSTMKNGKYDKWTPEQNARRSKK